MVDKFQFSGYNQNAKKKIEQISIWTICWNGTNWCIVKKGATMKQEIQPNYVEVTFVCACGAEFETRSTKNDIRLDICSKCHPFFTGKQKLVDTGGRVDRFKKRFGMEDK